MRARDRPRQWSQCREPAPVLADFPVVSAGVAAAVGSGLGLALGFGSGLGFEAGCRRC